MRSLVLSIILALAALGTLADPPAAQAQYWVGGYHVGPYAGWRGGSHYQWRGGSHYQWRGGSHYIYPGGYGYLGGYNGYSGSYLGYGGYLGSYLDYGGYGSYYRPSIGIGFTSYADSLYDSWPPTTSYSATSTYLRPAVSATVITTPSAPSYPDAVAGATYAEPAPADTRCRLEVRVPNATAQVFFNGKPTQQTGLSRQFASPPLTPGKTYNYTIEARWMEKGQVADQTRTVAVTASQTTAVDFTEPEGVAAPESVPTPSAPR